MAEFIFERYNYWAVIFLMMIGLYVTFQAGNMIKRLIGLSVFQTSVMLVVHRFKNCIPTRCRTFSF